MDQVSYEHWQASMTNSSDVFPSARPQPLTLPDGKPAIEAWPLDQSILHLNHGSFGAVPNSTLNAVAKYESQANRAPIGWFPRVGARIRDMRSQHAATIREFQESMSRLGLTAERRQGFWRQRQQSGANHHPQVGRAGVSVDYPRLSAEQS